MSKHSTRGRATEPKPSLYQEITAHIIADLEAGIFPWARPWRVGDRGQAFSLPVNVATGKSYSGINILILWGKMFACGFSRPRWLTFRQALDLGGRVRKGEHGVTVCYADRFIPKSTEKIADNATKTGAEERDASIPFLRRYTVFNVDQCENLPEQMTAEPAPRCDDECVPLAETLARATLADIRIGGEEAYYLPSADRVHIPPQATFFEPINFYQVLFHELGHWTGHLNRLNRDLTGGFGSRLYASEELVAELTAAFVCAALSIKPTVRHADYLGTWLSVLRDDSRVIFRAASKASKAADFLLAFSAGGVAQSENGAEPPP